MNRLASCIPYKALKTHCYISGGTWSGKSELMKLIFFLLQKRSRSKRSNTLILLDPHGDLVNEVKTSYLNRRDRERLVVLDSHLKKGMTYSINPLEVYDKGEENIQLMSQQLVKAFEETVSSRVSTNMGTLLQPCIAVLMREEGSTLADLQRFMNDGHNDDLVALGRQSPVEAHRTFFERDFYDKQQFGKTKSALSARIQFLLNNTTFYNLVCAKSTVNLEKEINSGKIILFNLAKWKSGGAFLDVFGRFVMASLMGYAFKRTDIPKKQRKPTFVFLDECQNFMTDSVITILAEARKYALHLVLANQYLDQLKDERKSALKSNANVKVVGVNDKDHFRKMASSMGVGHDELSKLPNYHFYVKVRGKKPYKLKTADFLIKNRYYTLGKEEKKKLDRRVLYDSGYYRKIRPNGKPLNARSTTKKEVHPPPRNRQFRFHNM